MILVILYGFLSSGELMLCKIVFICMHLVIFQITHEGVS